jgi:tetratricopeptide (TPR) repeat protein
LFLGLTKNINQQFYKVMKSYCLGKLQKYQEAQEVISELKQSKPNDPVISKYLVYAFNELGMYSETTALLEYILAPAQDNEELCEELFFSYVREGKLLK